MKIMAVCGHGLGSSFMLEMNIKKALKQIGVEAEVEHADLSSATPDAADLFVVGKDLSSSINVQDDKKVVLNSIIDKKELEEKLRAYINK